MKDRFIRIQRAVANNKYTKLIALVLAVITWYAVQPAISFETVVSDVPVRIQVDPGWAVLEQSVAAVDVHFRGSREAIRFLSIEQPEVSLDVRGLQYGDSLTMPIPLKNVRAPGGARPVYLRPGEVVLTIDQESEKVVPVKANVQGSPPDGIEVERTVTTPAVVSISGPRQRLETVDSVRTMPIDLEGRLQSFKARVAVVSPSKTWVARMEPERVDVEVVLVERSASAEWKDIAVRAMVSPGKHPHAEITPTRVNVVLKGRAELLDALETDAIQAFVDCSRIDADTRYDLPVTLHLPPRITAEAIEPPVVSVIMRD